MVLKIKEVKEASKKLKSKMSENMGSAVAGLVIIAGIVGLALTACGVPIPSMIAAGLTGSGCGYVYKRIKK